MTSRPAAPRQLALLFLTYGGALTLGALGNWVHLPLPWMIGGMVWTAALRLSNRPLALLPYSRPAGQILIGSSIGLAFTAESFTLLGTLFVPMLLAALGTVAAAFAVAALLVRLSGVDAVTATLAALPIGPVESATLAARHGVAPGPVIFAQTMRIMMLVVLIPPVMVALGSLEGDPNAVLRAQPWTPGGAGLLCLLAVAGALAARRVRLANPFFLGAIALAAAASAMGAPVAAYPYAMVVAAQLFLGTWLGGAFDRDLLRRAGRFVPATLMGSVVLILLCLGVAIAMSWLTGQSWETMVLSTAPGGATEMALTAKILGEGPAVVAAFQILRIFLILPLAPVMVNMAAKVSQRQRK